MRIARSTSSCTCAGAVCSQLLYAGENYPIVCRLIPGTWCADLTAALPCLECSGEWHRSTCAGHFRFLVSSRCKPDCGDQAPILCMSAYSQKLACAFAYQSGRQLIEAMELPAAAGPARLEAEFHSCRLSVFRQNKNTPGFLFPGVFFIRGCEKLSWYRCSWSQAGCCRHR